MNKETEQSFFRSIQDRFRLFEKKGFSFYPEVQPSFASKIRNRLKSKSEQTVIKNEYVYDDVVEAQIVIPIFGKSETLSGCIKSIEKSIGVKPKVVLVNNGCETTALEKVEHLSSIHHIIKNESNNGYGQGCHQGIEYFSSGNIILLNSDAILQPQSIRELLNVLDSNMNIAVACSVPINSDGTIQEYGRVIQKDGHSLPLDENRQIEVLKNNEVKSMPYASFVCTAIKTKDYFLVDGFDKKLSPAYSEDIDLCIRLWNEKRATVVVSNSIIMHSSGESSSQLANIEKIKQKNREFVVKKHLGLFNSLIDNVNSSNYPHEINLLKKRFLGTAILVIVDKNISVAELEVATGIKSELWILNSIFIFSKSFQNDAKELSAKGVAVNQWSPAQGTHHFLRNHIGYFDKAIVGIAPNDDINLQMTFLTQPFAEFETG